MPRVTRRSVASKGESTPEESTRSTSRGRRGAKKEEPPAEDVDIGEPQETSTRRGGRQAAKETKTAAKGRSTSRGGRGKKEEEPPEENAEEEEEAEEEEKPQRGARSRGRGKGRGGKAAAKGGRGRRSKAAEEEEEEEKEEDEKEEATEETEAPVKGRRGRGQSKATPPPRGGRRGRGAVAAEEENEEESKEEQQEETDKATEQKDEASKGAEENEVEESPKGRQRRTPNKAAEPAATTPPSSGRRGRGQKSEPTPDALPASGRSSRRRGEAAPAEEQAEEKKEEAAAEPMETESTETPAEKMEAKPTEPEQADSSAPEPTLSESASETPSPSKKRKLEDEDEGDHVAKRPRPSESETSMETKDELEDFVVVNKDDVPAPDSKEVTDVLPPPVSAKSSEPQTPEDIRPEGPKIQPQVPFMVPLTEAELAKQYTSLRQDKDETSSTLVEVGSEGVADITALSSRGLDTSDAVSMDSATMDQITGDTVSEQAMDSNSSSSLPAQETSAAPSIQSTAPSVPAVGLPSQSVIPPQVNAAQPSQAVQQNISSNAAPPPPPPPSSVNPVAAAAPSPAQPSPNPVAAASSPIVEPSPVVVTNISQQTQRPPAPVEVHAGPAPPSQTPSQNGTSQDTPQVNSSPVVTSNPVKTVTVAPAPYVPSSTAIDCRKFILNPAFPLEMMDPAFCFSVVSYNILADCHLRRGNYSYTQPQFLDQSYRHELLLKELDYLDGDIVCLQEVNGTYYNEHLVPAMKTRGYEGLFMKRTKDYWDEGEATFVRTSKFDIISKQGVSLKDLAFTEVQESGVNAEIQRAATKYLDRADIILLTELLCKKTGKKITVCNIHVVYAPGCPDVQCIQVACAIKELVRKAGNDLSPHVICGDFNSTVTSPGYQLAKDGYLSDVHIHKLQALEALDNTDGSSRSLINHMWRSFQHTSSNLRSAYELTMGKEPPVTTFTRNDFKSVDYIFHSAASMDTVGVLETLDKEVIQTSGGLPNHSIPSDHLSIKAVFRLKDAA